MELRHLQYFLTIAREGTISGAAQALHLSQPSLSRQMQDLERELDVKLFNRGSRHIELTEEGMRLRRRAEEIVDLVGRTEAELRVSAETIAGEVRLARYETLALPACDRWGVFMRRDDPLCAREVLRVEDLVDMPLILSAQGNSELGPWFHRDADELDIVATYNLLYNAAALARAGVGYVVSLEGIVETTLATGLTFRPLEPPVTASITIAWKRYQALSPAAEAFQRRITALWGNA